MPSGRMVRGDVNGGKGAGPWTRGTRLALIAALAIMVPFIMASGAAAKGAPRSFFGVVPWLEFQGADYQRLAEAKVHNARTPFYWPAIEPTKGSYNWKATDKFVGTLALYHVRVLPFLNGSPSWVASDARRPPLKSKKAKRHWKQFVKACVKRYGPKGKFWRTHSDIPKVPIKAWQIWNEQNNPNYFAPKPKPKKYAKLVKLAKRAIHSKDKHGKIVLGGMFGKPEPKGSMSAPKFLGKFYKAKGIKHAFNAMTVHPYAPSIHNLKKQMTKLHKVIKHKHDNAKMWITEMGWGSAPPEKRWPLLKGVQGQEEDAEEVVPPAHQAPEAVAPEARLLVPVARRAPDAPTNCSFCKSSGLFRNDFQPKPAWNAFLKITHHH